MPTTRAGLMVDGGALAPTGTLTLIIGVNLLAGALAKVIGLDRGGGDAV